MEQLYFHYMVILIPLIAECPGAGRYPKTPILAGAYIRSSMQFHTPIELVGTFGAVSANAGGCERAPWVNPVTFF